MITGRPHVEHHLRRRNCSWRGGRKVSAVRRRSAMQATSLVPASLPCREGEHSPHKPTAAEADCKHKVARFGRPPTCATGAS